jgi:hypothetical protein
LIQNDDGRIVRVYGKTEDGGYIRFNATKGVVLATGDYEYNPERQQKCLRPRDRVTYWLNACLGNQLTTQCTVLGDVRWRLQEPHLCGL